MTTLHTDLCYRQQLTLIKINFLVHKGLVLWSLGSAACLTNSDVLALYTTSYVSYIVFSITHTSKNSIEKPNADTGVLS